MCLYSIFELWATLKNGVDFLSESFGRPVTAAAHLARVRGRTTRVKCPDKDNWGKLN
jgi:hypothetical protein